eukprot:TRINITY_DN9612_c0_g1_i1.p1 TRINITY_DN9612_c0_g1~~TRINITY_DN9612_c0_g1_i1.p1  ORF type:complete len:135 (+),score=35.96 TRINITY_DN9612_c0_g1_i1:95-499(+)
MIRRPPRFTHCISSAASDVQKRKEIKQTTLIEQHKMRNKMREYNSQAQIIIRKISSLKQRQNKNTNKKKIKKWHPQQLYKNNNEEMTAEPSKKKKKRNKSRKPKKVTKKRHQKKKRIQKSGCLLYTSPSPREQT